MTRAQIQLIIRAVMSESVTPYRTLHDYMERTGTSPERLLEQANLRLRGAQKMSRSLLHMILRGSRRCSGEKAWALHQVTGVSMDVLTEWPRSTWPDMYRSNDGDLNAER